MGSDAKVYAVVVLMRFMFSGMHVMSKVALDQGMSPLVFLFYRLAAAALALIPAVFLLERPKAKLVTLRIAGKMFIHALYGVTAAGDLFNLGLNYASASSSSALYNIQPVVTFILAVMFGRESMKLKKFHGMVKLAGILFCIAGVTVLALYEGPMFKSFNHHRLFPHGSDGSPAGDVQYSRKQWAQGIFFMVVANVLVGLWTVHQVFWASVQAFVVAAVSERDFSKWKLGWDVNLFTVLYSGVIVTAFSGYLLVWTIAEKGPVFLAVSTPLTMIFTIIISSFVLGDAVSLGSIVAGVLLVGGLYNVLWGKHIDAKDGTVCGKPDLELQDREAQVADEETKVFAK